MEGTPLLRLFLPRLGFTRYVMQRSQEIISARTGTPFPAFVTLRPFNVRPVFVVKQPMNTDVILEIDAGNTEFKWRIVSAEGVLSSGRAGQAKVGEVFASALKKHAIDRVRAVSVAGEEFDLSMQASLENCGLSPIEFAFVERELAGVRCGYEDLSQLGVDRWMAIIAASTICRGPIMIADMGSAVTIDLVNARRRHRGGYIVPGWRLMQESLSQGSRIDPLRIPDRYQAEMLVPGLNTKDAIGMGRLKVITAMIDSVCDEFKEAEEGATLVCTGGDAPNIIPHLRSEANYVADLVLDGLSIALG